MQNRHQFLKGVIEQPKSIFKDNRNTTSVRFFLNMHHKKAKCQLSVKLQQEITLIIQCQCKHRYITTHIKTGCTVIRSKKRCYQSQLYLLKKVAL